jgi:IclR family transcriptional regulator, acetate operon repressor
MASPMSAADPAPSLALDRALAIIELLTAEPGGLPLLGIAEQLGIPRSATHRLLTSLLDHGYVRQDRDRGFYTLTSKLLSLAFTHLAVTGIVDTAQPVLERLAAETSELVRLSVVDGDRLTWVAKAQGARSGLRYDPEMGMEARLSCSATGFAWLSTMTDADALALVAQQGFGPRDMFGPNAPPTPEELLRHLEQARRKGYSVAVRTFYDWMAAIAAPVRHPVSGAVVGTVSIAGPITRLDEQRLEEMAPLLLAAAAEISSVMPGSPALAHRAGSSSAAPVRRVS